MLANVHKESKHFYHIKMKSVHTKLQTHKSSTIAPLHYSSVSNSQNSSPDAALVAEMGFPNAKGQPLMVPSPSMPYKPYSKLQKQSQRQELVGLDSVTDELSITVIL